MKFEIGDKVICQMNDRAVYPIFKDCKYIITNITVDEEWVIVIG